MKQIKPDSSADLIVELETGVYAASWPGDPGRCLDLHNAQRFPTQRSANAAITRARRFQPFRNAKVLRFTDIEKTFSVGALVA